MKLSETIRHAALGVGAIAVGCGLMMADMKAHSEARHLWSAAKLIARHGLQPAASALFDARETTHSTDDDSRMCQAHVLVLREGGHVLRIEKSTGRPCANAHAIHVFPG